MSDVPVIVKQAKFSDFEVLRDAVQDAPMNIVQLEPGKMTGTLTHLSVGTIGISHGAFSRGVRSRGVLSERRWALGMVLDAPATMQHFEVAPGDIVTVAPDYEGYARYYGANHYAAVFIEPDELFAYLESQQPQAAEAAVWQRSTTVLDTDPATAAARTRELRALLKVLAKDGPTLPTETVHYYKLCLLELMTAPLIESDDYRHRGPRSRNALELVRKVDRFLSEAGSRPVHISDLVGHFGVPRRSLHHAFTEVLGMSPMQFFRRKRLGDAHNALLTAVPGVTVQAVALKHGFLHVGRFAREYQFLFGELPSETLRRSASFKRSRRFQWP